jgi:uncharacterized membrane protein (UPF0127 family)
MPFFQNRKLILVALLTILILLTQTIKSSFAQNNFIDRNNYNKNLKINRQNQAKNNQIATLKVAIADDDNKRTTGLMHINKLNKGNGMLFIYNKPQTINIWMKNTKIPLDIIFIDQNWRINKIHHNATPYSLDIISSPQQTIAALEVNAGELPLQINDQIIYETF